MNQLSLLSIIIITYITPFSLISKQANTIDIAINSTPNNLDPRYGNDAYSFHIQELLFESLITFDKNLQWHPSAATVLTTPTTTTIDIKIKNNLTFSDGEPLTSKDVKATFDYIRNPNTQPPSVKRASLKNIKDIEIKSDTHLIIHLDTPDVAFISNNLNIGIVPHRFLTKSADEFQSSLIGSGPYKLNSKKGKLITLTKNETFTGDQPKINQINFHVIEDDNSRYLQLLKGKVHLTDAISSDHVAAVKRQKKNLHIHSSSGLNTHYVLLNFKDTSLQNKNVRQALAYGINRDEIIKYQLHGLVSKANALLPDYFPYYASDTKTYDYNPKKAKALLAEAGFKKGLTLSLKAKSSNEAQTICSLIANQLKKIGITLNVQGLEWGTLSKDRNNGNFQLMYLAWVGFKDPDLYRYVFHSQMTPPNGANRGYVNHTTFDTLTELGQKEHDLNKRIKTYQELMRFETEFLPYIYLWHKHNIFVSRTNLSGFKLYPNGSFQSLIHSTLN